MGLVMLRVGGSEVLCIQRLSQTSQLRRNSLIPILFRTLRMTDTDLFIGNSPRMSRLSLARMERLIYVMSYLNKERPGTFLSLFTLACLNSRQQRYRISFLLPSPICFKGAEVVAHGALTYHLTIFNHVSDSYCENENLISF